MQSIRFLTVEEVIRIHCVQIIQFGGMHGIRDIALLESAVRMPQAGFGSEYLHKNVHEMAAAYLYHIVKNHPFMDGNKRTGALAALSFLDLHDVKVAWSNDEIYQVTLQVATSQVTKEQLAQFFAQKI